ncbi:MAG: Crp/Fnr family transcriptional regulator [Clostridia bacterium]|nr:Crp/Fnr family transcriptional regulator [Clostridia bacterium]
MTDEKKLAKIADIMNDIPLFRAIDRRSLFQLIQSSDYRVYLPGELIEGDTPCLPVILSGKAAAYGKSPDRSGVMLRLLGAGSVFGVSYLFNDGDGTAISTVRAESETEALLIPQNAISELIHRDGDFAERYIRLLGGKIRFLGGRIEAFTAGSAELKLAWYLINLDGGAEDCDGGAEILLESSISRLADMLSIGRASLYRALGSLEQKGFITHSERHITIKDRAALRHWLNGQ